MGSVFVQNTTTRQIFHFFLSRNSARKDDNIKRLTPGSYTVIRSSLEDPAKYRFRGNFQIIDNQGKVPIVPTITYRSTYPYYPSFPNFIVPSAQPPGTSPLVILEQYIFS